MEMTERMNLDQNWKKMLMYGSFGAAAILLATGKRPAALAAAGIGVAFFAAEHPERFEQVWNRAPEYLDKGQRVVSQLGGLVDRITEQSAKFQSRNRQQGDYLT
jgi:hypothetical protein